MADAENLAWRVLYYQQLGNIARLLLEVTQMLRMALVFLVIALLAALFGFGLIADLSFGAAKILFFVFLVLAVLSLIAGAFQRPPA